MSAIFISHSSKDNAWAERITIWLKEQGYEGIFLDFDPQVGIPAGRDWKQELYHQLRRCRAVIAVCSEHFTASQWCLSEVAIASNLGKSLFPIQVGPCTTPALLSDRQVIDLTADAPKEAFRRLGRGLAEAGLDPKDIFQWDPKRPPYPGLMAFQEKDAPVFFGRGEAIQEGLDRLHNLRRYGGKALLLVLGASGCGKSSLARAGIVPRLRRDQENWLVLDPFRPGLDPLAELADALSKAFSASGKASPELPATAEDLQRQLEDLRRSSGQREATVVIPIDQFEELLGNGGDSAAEQRGGDLFLAFLRGAMQDTTGRLVVLATMRSDFLGTFQCHRKLLGLPFEDLKLGPMEVEGYTKVIEGPAEVAGLTLEPGLSERLVADTQTGDALPLLAFTLRELWERYGRDGDLTLTEYGNLGGLGGSVQRAADGVIQARTLSPEETQAVRRAFLTMTRINEQGQYARIPARWEDMQPQAREVLKRFVEARLLISGKENGTIEVAHEALLRTWPLLKGWLEDGKEFLLWRSRFQAALAEHARSGTLLTGKPLTEAEHWREATAVDSPERKLIEASLAEQKHQRQRNRLLVAVGGLAVAVFTGGVWWQFRSFQEWQTQREWQTQVFEKEHLRLIDTDPLESLVNGLAALARHMDSPGMNYQLILSLAQGIERNFALSRPIATGQGVVWSLVELKNGELISGGSDGSLRRWKDGQPVGDGKPIATGQAVRSLVELNNGELISGGSNGTLRRWKDGKAVGKPIATGQGVVESLVELKNGELISGGSDGSLRRWKDGKPLGDGKPIATGQGEVVRLVELRNGELISGGQNGTLRRWKDGQPVGKLIATGQVDVWDKENIIITDFDQLDQHVLFRISLVQLKNGELISGGEDGSFRRWKDGKPVDDGKPFATGQRSVTSLVQLKNGELISGGSDGSLRLWKEGQPVGVGQPITAGQGGLTRLVELKNGELISGGFDGTLRRWKDGKPVGDGKPIATGQRGVWSLVELKNGELISGGQNGTLRRWKDGKPVGDGKPIATGQVAVMNLVELQNGELISGGADGSLRRWKDGKAVGDGKPIATGQGVVESLVELKNGELISGGRDGSLRRWKDGKAVGDGKPIATGQGAVFSLVALKNGELISGGKNGTLRRWKDGQPVGDGKPIATGQGGVRNLVALKNGELISAGEVGTLRRWKDGKPVGDDKPIDIHSVNDLVELKNGELIIGGGSGSLLIFSPRRLAQALCQEELPVLLLNPVSLAEKEGKALCERLGF
jgi:WD40 repeat protein